MTGIERFFSGMRAAASGMAAERVRIDVIASNIANAETLSTPSGGPYRRRVVEFEPILQRLQDGSALPAGVRVRQVVEDFKTPMEKISDPDHPLADAEGLVTRPNVNPTLEMADLITAVRAYESNISVQESFQRMAERALRMLQ